MTRIVIINGTNNAESRVNGVQHFIAAEVEDVQAIEVYKLPAEALINGEFANIEIVKANAVLAKANVVVVLTPVYKAAYTGILKTFLDLIPQKGLEGKTMIPIAVGGSAYHLLAIDYALKPVLAALGATSILQGVYIIDKEIERIGEKFTLSDHVQERLKKQLNLVSTVQV